MRPCYDAGRLKLRADTRRSLSSSRPPPSPQLGGASADHRGVRTPRVSSLAPALLAAALGTCLAGAGGSAIAADDAPAAAATLALRAASTPARVHAGKGVTYAIAVSNPGSQEAISVGVCDKLPAGVAYIRAFNGGVLRAGTVCWTIGTLAGGQSRKVSVLVRARPTARVRQLRNTATATAANAAPVSAGVTTYVLRGPRRPVA
jgi:uncharacterized repeat protein (TIGR01451 family)